jgi:hypothetical protein
MSVSLLLVNILESYEYLHSPFFVALCLIKPRKHMSYSHLYCDLDTACRTYFNIDPCILMLFICHCDFIHLNASVYRARSLLQII